MTENQATITIGSRVMLMTDLESSKAGRKGTVCERLSDETPGIEWDDQQGVIQYRDRLDGKIIELVNYVQLIQKSNYTLFETQTLDDLVNEIKGNADLKGMSYHMSFGFCKSKRGETSCDAMVLFTDKKGKLHRSVGISSKSLRHVAEQVNDFLKQINV